LDSIVIGGYIFFCYDTQYRTDQTAVGTVHMITILMFVVWPLLADDGRESGAIHCHHHTVLRFYVV